MPRPEYPNGDALVQRLYEAAADPCVWPSALDALGDALGGGVIVVSRQTADAPVLAVTHRLDPAGDAVLRAQYSRPQKNPLMGSLRHVPVLSLVARDTIMSDRQYFGSGLYSDVFRAQRLHHVALSCLRRDGGVLTVCGLLSRDGTELDGREAQLFGRMLPHLRGALEVAARLAKLERSLASARIGADATESGIVVVNACGFVRFVNAAGEAILSRGDGLCQRGGMISATTTREDQRLSQLIDAAARRSVPGGGSMRIERVRDTTPLGVIVLPAPARFSGDGEPCALVVLVDFAASRTPPAGRIAEIFGLTQAEAAVALAVLEGKRPEDIAEERGARIATVRSQIRTIFAKTETRSQADLVRVLGKIPSNLGA